MKIVVSACLAGVNCRYDGKSNEVDWIKALYEKGLAIPVCPECLGGLPIPRTPCELQENLVKSREGQDFTIPYYTGAYKAFHLAKLAGANNIAILKAKSPSCGALQIYDGSFTRTLIFGDGVFTNLLRKSNFIVCTEKDFDKIKEYIYSYYVALYDRK